MSGLITIKNESAVILANENIAPGYYRMVIGCEAASFHFAPGQFFQLRIFPDKLDPLLRRPFAPSEFTPHNLAFIYLVVGTGTRLMAGLKPGEPVEVLLPLGNGYTLPEDDSTQAVLVGGGCGMPSLRLLAKSLAERGNPVYAALGAPGADTLLEVPAFREAATALVLATDDGSEGIKGTAVDAAAGMVEKLDENQPIEFYACGPMAMLRGLAKFTREHGFPCQVSLDARMACGFGACYGCVVKVKDQSLPEGYVYQRVCREGPVFAARDLVWE